MISRENITREALSDLEAKRADNHRIEKERREEAERRSPLVRTLLEQRQNLFFGGIRSAFARPQEAHSISSTMGQEVDRLNKEIRKALVACGLPEDYLQPVYSCPDCKDTGYVGELIRTQCNCVKRAVMNKLYQNAGYGILAKENFSTFDETIFPDVPMEGHKGTQREYIRRIRTLCEQYADGFVPEVGYGLILSGRTGVGKTFMMNCIAQRVLERGYSVVLITADRLFEVMRQNIFGDGDDERVADILACDLLCVDDLGTEPMMRGITVGALYQVVNERRNNDRSILLTTNLDAEGIYRRYDDRIGARLTDPSRMKIVTFPGVDVRRFIPRWE